MVRECRTTKSEPSSEWLWYAVGTRAQGLGGAVSLGFSRRSGLTEKNLLRHSAQRNAGSPRIRPIIDVWPGTCSGAIRCKFRLPQIRQCANTRWRNGARRARNLVWQDSQRHGRTPPMPSRCSKTLRRRERRNFEPRQAGQTTSIAWMFGLPGKPGR